MGRLPRSSADAALNPGAGIRNSSLENGPPSVPSSRLHTLCVARPSPITNDGWSAYLIARPRRRAWAWPSSLFGSVRINRWPDAQSSEVTPVSAHRHTASLRELQFDPAAYSQPRRLERAEAYRRES